MHRHKETAGAKGIHRNSSKSPKDIDFALWIKRTTKAREKVMRKQVTRRTKQE